MTIGFDASRAFIEGRTGTENYSFQLLKALAKIDGSTSLTTGTENQYLIYLRPNVIPSNEGIQLADSAGSSKSFRKNRLLDPRLRGDDNYKWPENFKFVTINMPRLWTQLGLALRTWIDPLDVLFVSSHTLPLMKKPDLKTVLTVHDLGAVYLPGFHQLKQVLYLQLMTHYQLKTATKIIAVSAATKRDIIQRVGVPEKNIKVVYEGVDKTTFKRISKDIVNDIVKKYDIQRGKYFLFVGTIQPRKNLERLITAFSDFLSRINTASRDVAGSKEYVARENDNSKTKSHTTNSMLHTTKFKLIMVGQKGWKSEAIYNLPKKLGIEDRVLFTGRISDEELVGLYNGATALVYPSLFEGFGLPILEAFACGCPVITSNISSMPEIAGEAAVFVDPYSIEDIAQAMLKVSSNDVFRSSMIKKGIVRAGQFDWEKTAKETLEILKSI